MKREVLISKIIPKPLWRIVDDEGNVLKKGFRHKQGAKNMIPSLRLNKKEKLKVEAYKK